MLDLSPALADLVLDCLNQSEHIAAWTGTLDTPEFSTHTHYEKRPYDTTASEWRRNACVMIDEWLLELSKGLDRADSKPVGGGLLGTWLRCEDAFAVSDGDGVVAWVAERVSTDRPFSAIRVGCTVFYLSGNGKRKWRMRPWNSVNGKQDGGSEPLMRLPYQRKYDTERHARADQVLQRYHDHLHIVYDLLEVLRERVEDQRPGRDGWTWPESADIKEEMERIGFGLADSGLGFGPFRGLSLHEMHISAGSLEPQLGFEVATGTYSGVLGGYHRRPGGQLRTALSGASVKYMVSGVLTQLQGQVFDIACECVAHGERLEDDGDEMSEPETKTAS